jgi:hypothetical protein
MKRAIIALSALGLVAAAAQPAPAAWNNVFQPTLFNRHRQPAAVSQYYVAPTVVQSSPIVAGASPCNTCQQTVCSQSYVQRCYYQPVVTYQTQTHYEPVTTYKTSYYYEPVTTYRYSAYYDPCSCSYQQVATPCTSYQLKAQSCPVQSWVARCTQVPVTSYQKSCYYQPQTTCCTTTQGAPVQSVPIQSAPMQNTPAPPPIIEQQGGAPSMRDVGPPQVEEKKAFGTGGSMYDRLYPPSTPKTPVMPPASMKLPLPSPTNPSVKLEGIVMGPAARVDGQVVRNDNSPKASAKLIFVNAQAGQRYFATANTAGRFSVSLPSGNWNVYVYGSDDLPTYSTQVSVVGSQTPAFTLVSR